MIANAVAVLVEEALTVTSVELTSPTSLELTSSRACIIANAVAVLVEEAGVVAARTRGTVGGRIGRVLGLCVLIRGIVPIALNGQLPSIDTGLCIRIFVCAGNRSENDAKGGA